MPKCITFEIDGRWVRRCRVCEETKDLHRDFPRSKNRAHGRGYECKACLAEIGRLWREDPKHRQEATRRQREWKARQTQEQMRTKGKKRWRRLKNNQKRLRRRNEDRRIQYRLKAAREGRSVRKSSVSPPAVGLPRLPADALVRFIEARKDEHSDEAVCAELDISPRRLRAWRSGESKWVQFDVADRVLVAAGVGWWQVWPEDEYPDVWEAMTR